MKLEILNHLPESSLVNSGCSGLVKMSGAAQAIFAEMVIFVAVGKNRTASETKRGVDRLKIHCTFRAQKAVHGLFVCLLDGCTQTVISLFCRMNENPAKEAATGKDGFCKGFNDLQQGLCLHFPDHGFGKTRA
jgi:hypothetical protein